MNLQTHCAPLERTILQDDKAINILLLRSKDPNNKKQDFSGKATGPLILLTNRDTLPIVLPFIKVTAILASFPGLNSR